MNLEPDRMLAHYRLVEKLGAGGMGVVWRAHDTTLGRDVAIKVLPDLFAGDPDRLARFEREARLLASLNHPGIAGIHGFHEAEGVRFLAMELAAGTTLAQRIQAGPLPVDEALAIGLQVADALEAAHESGIVHRDLKPGNIQVSADGRVKVLDFGLAKAFEPDASSPATSMSPTLTTPATRAGIILGTAAYMSPEQARGRTIDRRADIWAFGCVLYEMLTGTRTFGGDDISTTLAAVIMSPVDLEKLPAGTPASIRRLIQRCLERDPRRRLRDIGEARLLIEAALSGSAAEFEPVSGVAPATESRAARRARWPAIAAAMLAASAATAALMWSIAPERQESPRLRRYEIAASGPFRSETQAALLAISPDGSRVAYVDAGRIRIRALDRLEPRPIDTPAEPLALFWSPDSRWLGFATAGRIWKAPVDGGASALVTDQAGQFSGGSGISWGPGGRIVLARGDTGLYELPERGGDLRTLLELEAGGGPGGDIHAPSFLPDGSGILFTVHAPNGRPDTLAILEDGRRRDLYRIEGQDIWHPVYSASGHIVYRRQPTNTGIWALPFSLKDRQVKGEPFLISAEGDVPSVSEDGTLVYGSGSTSRMTQMVWIDRTGKVVGKVGQPQEQWPFPSLSPDGRLAAIAAQEGEGYEVWIHDVERGTRTRLTFSGGADAAVPAWTPQGDRLVLDKGTSPFVSVMLSADGGGKEVEVARGWSSTFSPDGSLLLYAMDTPDSALDIYYRDLRAGGEPVPIVGGDGVQLWPRLSPDGRFIAYISNESGQDEVYIKRFPSGEGKWQVSTAGGYWPKWSSRGDRIYYVRDETLLEVDITAGPSIRLGQPREVFTRRPLGRQLVFGWPAGFDVSADGERFLICQSIEEVDGPEAFVLVENWYAEFQRSD